MAIAVVEKTLAVLEALASAERPLALQDLAVPLHMPKPTVYRILQTLLALGYVGQEERTGFYFTTSRLANLGHPNPYVNLQRRARPLVDGLFAQFNETVNLGILEGLFVRYIDVVETTQPLRHVAAPRARDQFTSTAIGRAFVAFLPLAEQDRLVGRANLQPLTPLTITNPAALKAELAASRRRGWSQEEGENDVDLVCFGAPILAPASGHQAAEGLLPVAAISISVPRFRMNPGRKKEMTEALAEITHAAGLPPTDEKRKSAPLKQGASR